MSRTPRHIHLSGICGTAMASIAGLLQLQGHRITGSDKAAYPPMSDMLRNLGIPVLEPYSESNLDPAPDLVIHMIAMGEADARPISSSSAMRSHAETPKWSTSSISACPSLRWPR